MHNLFQIILQSWQMAKKSPLLWIFSAGIVFSSLLNSYPSVKPNGDATWNKFLLVCSGCTSSLLVLFISTFSLYGLICCSGAALQGVEIKFSQVWTSFKANFFKVLLLGIFVGIYIFILFAFSLLFRWLLISFTGSFFSEAFLLTVIFTVVNTLYGGVIILSPCGMVFQGMDAFQSFWDGLKTFSIGRASFVGLVLIFYIPTLLVSIFAINAILATGQALSYANYQSVMSVFPSRWIGITISFFTYPVFYLSMLKVYFDITAAKNIGENLQTVVTLKT